MTREEALVKVRGYLTDLIPSEDYDEVEEIMLALEQQPCEDCISRQAARNALLNKGQHSKRYKLGETWELNLMEIEETLGSLPSVELERKPGKWIEHQWAEEENGLLISNYECNLCKMWERKTSDFCPNCGAKMEGADG